MMVFTFFDDNTQGGNQTGWATPFVSRSVDSQGGWPGGLTGNEKDL